MAGLLDFLSGDASGGGLLGGASAPGMSSALSNPLLQIGLGILAANKPGASLGQAVGQGGLLGIQNMQRGQQVQGINQLRQAQLTEAQRKMAREDNWTNMVRGLLGMGVAPIPNAPGAAPQGPQLASIDPNASYGAPGSAFTADPNAPGAELRSPPSPMPAASGARPLLAGIPREMYPAIMDPEKGPALLASFASKNMERGQFVPEDRVIGGVKVPGQVDRLSGKWAPLDPSLTKVSVGVTLPPEQDAESKKVGAFYGDAFTNLQNATLQNPGKRARFQRLDTLLDNVDTGTGAPTTLALKKAAKGVGIDLDALGIKDNVGPAEAGQALANEMALELRNPQGGAGMPGALSNADRSFLQSMSPGLATTGPGRKLILQTRLKLMDREDKVAQMARDYRHLHKHIDEGFFDQLAAYSEKNPIFSQGDAAKLSGGSNAAAGVRILNFDASGNLVR